MEKQIYEVLNAWKAKEKTFYIYQGVVYHYGKIKHIKHQHRFFRVCKAENYQVKLKENIAEGWKVIFLD